MPPRPNWPKTCQKRYNLLSIQFPCDDPNSAKEIDTIKNNMAILEQNQNIPSSHIQKTFIFVNITYMQTDTNHLLFKSLQKDILQTNSTVHHLSKEMKALFHDRNFLIIMFQLKSHLATLNNGINSARIDILSIFNQVLVISSQKHKPALLNQSDLKLLLTKLENQLVLTPG